MSYRPERLPSFEPSSPDSSSDTSGLSSSGTAGSSAGRATRSDSSAPKPSPGTRSTITTPSQKKRRPSWRTYPLLFAATLMLTAATIPDGEPTDPVQPLEMRFRQQADQQATTFLREARDAYNLVAYLESLKPPPPPPPAERATTRTVSAPTQPTPPSPETGGGDGRCGGDLPPCSVMMRESGGDIRAENNQSSASGKWQFIDSTWGGYGGYAHASDAPEHIQNRPRPRSMGRRSRLPRTGARQERADDQTHRCPATRQTRPAPIPMRRLRHTVHMAPPPVRSTMPRLFSRRNKANKSRHATPTTGRTMTAEHADALHEPPNKRLVIR